MWYYVPAWFNGAPFVMQWHLTTRRIISRAGGPLIEVVLREHWRDATGRRTPGRTLATAQVSLAVISAILFTPPEWAQLVAQRAGEPDLIRSDAVIPTE